MRETIAAKPELVQIGTAYGGQKEGSPVLPRNEYTAIRDDKPKSKNEGNAPNSKCASSPATATAIHRRTTPRSINYARYLASDDPEFETKAADIIWLYLNPPQHAAVFCVDEKTAILALDRLDPVLPLSPVRVERHGFEYYWHGTLSLYAAPETTTCSVLGKTAARHSSQDCITFLKELFALSPIRQKIHIILHNLSAHKTKLVRQFLDQRPCSN